MMRVAGMCCCGSCVFLLRRKLTVLGQIQVKTLNKHGRITNRTAPRGDYTDRLSEQ